MALTKVTERMSTGEIVSVMDFGAVADGVTDDGPAIQAAIDSTNGFQYKRLVFPTGTYMIKTPINLTDLRRYRRSIIDFQNSQIYLETSGQPGFDCTGTGWLTFANGFINGQSSNSPSSAILFAPKEVNDTQFTNDMQPTLSNMFIDGTFTKCPLIAIGMAPLTFNNEVKLFGGTKSAISISRTNVLSEASVYSTIATTDSYIDANSFWAGERAFFSGGDRGASEALDVPVIQVEGRCNYMNFDHCYIGSPNGGPQFEIDVTNESITTPFFVRDIRTEAPVTPRNSIVIKGDNTVGRLNHSGGRWVNDTYLVRATGNSTVGGTIKYPLTSDGGGGGDDVSLYNVSSITTIPTHPFTVTNSITGSITAYGSNSQEANLSLPAASDEKYKFITTTSDTDRSHVSVRLSSDQTVTAGNTDTIEFDTEEIDNLTEFNTTTYTFTATHYGLYLIAGYVSCSAAGTPAVAQVTLDFSSAPDKNVINQKDLTGQDSIDFSFVQKMEAGETLSLTLAATTNNVQIESAARKSILTITRI